MGLSTNSLIKIGILKSREYTTNFSTNGIHNLEDVMVLANVSNLNKFIEQIAVPSDLNVILLGEHPNDGTDQSPLVALRRLYPRTSIIYFSTNQDINHILWAINAGAIGYIPTTTIPTFFMESLRQFLQQKQEFIMPPLLLLKVLLHSYPLETNDYNGYHLTKTEINIALWIQKGYTPSDIAQITNKSIHNIHKHLHHIFDKTKLKKPVKIV
jgi:DNA-binding NarL/FixJ family response regulator